MPSPSQSSRRAPVCALTILSLGLIAFLTGCTGAQSSTTIVGPPAKLAITTQPGNVAAGSTTLSVTVSIEDANGHVVTTSNDQVSLAIQNNPSSGTLSGTVQATAVSGVATFSNLSINNSGALYTLSASATSLTGATTNPFNVFGPATKLAFTTPPGGGTGGSAWAQQPTVTVEDANNVPVSNSALTIALAITSGTGASGAALTCTGNPLAATAGVASFAACKIDKSANGYTLTATATGLTSGVSSAFNITVGAAAQLVFTTQPGGGSGGTAWTTQPAVTVEDAGGNTVTTSSASITLAITSGTGASGATLACTTNPLAATAGLATFAGCKIDKAGTGYTLAATATGLTTATSSAFSITIGAATKLAFTTQPGGGASATVWATQPVVAIQDAGGNTVTSSLSISLAITSGTGTSGAALTCTTNPLAATAGMSAFAGCKIDKVGNGYTLTATASGLTNGVSAALNITTGAATQLVFTTQPGGGTGGTVWSIQPVITVEDAGGNTVNSSTASITLAITSGTGATGATLTCTSANPLAASSGVASFAGCKIDKASSNTYTLTATSSGLPNAVSSTFTIAVGAATQLAFTTQPNGGTAATAWTQQPAVTVQDAGGNTVNSSLAITLAITNGTGTSGAVLSCTANTIPAIAGTASFAGCQINLAGSAYTLTASATGVSSGASSPFSISAGTATQLSFTIQPQTTPQSTNMASISVAVKDAQGNTVTTSTASIALAITSGTGTGGATFACTGGNTLAASSGVATFASCQINSIGTGYTLTASSTGLTSAVSTTFNITISVGPATKLVFTTQPGGGTGGTAWATQPIVSVEDANGNTVTTGTGSNASITLAITSGTGAAGAALTCTSANPLAATAGVASFVGCKINLASGNTYTLTATATGLTNAVSSTFSVTVGAATQLVFTTQPSGGSGGTAWSTQPAVTVEDAGGNTVTGSSASISLAITSGTGTSGATLSCTTNPLSVTAGVATFAACKIDKAGTGYTLAATATGLTSATSSSFSITIGAATKLAFTTQPGGGASAAAWTTQPAVTIEDAGGNTVNSSLSVSLAITGGTGTSGATLTCTSNPLGATAGVATFAGCKIDMAGNNYTLTASASGLTNGTSSTFNITVGTATQLVFTTQPGGANGGAVFTTQPVVTIEDAGGNTIGSSTSITLAITSGAGASGATLTCTNNTLVATAGVATFAGCKIDKAGTGYTLTATASGLTNGVSSTFTVAVGAAAQLKFTTQPGNGAVSTAWPQQPVVTIQDAGGNTLTGSSASVQLSITIGTGATGAVLTCTANPLAASSGVATFAGCQINLAGTGYTLTASSSGLPNTISGTFSVASFGTATKLVFTTQPGGGTGGNSWAQQPVVAVEDSGGNTVLTSSASITLQITSGTGATNAKLTCNNNTLSAASGVAGFSGCAIDLASGGYTLTATATGLTNGASSSFTVSVGPATKLAFTTQPGGGTGGLVWSQQPVVAVQDAGGNTVTSSTAQIGLTIVSGTGPGTLTCTNNLVNAIAGVASFAGCKINIQSTGYALFAGATGLNNADSLPFNVTVGPAARLVFGTQPNGAIAGTAFSTQPVIIVKDAGADTVTSSTASITLSLTTGPGTLTCTGSNTLAATSGVATFAGCQISASGVGDVITATASSLTNPTIQSNPFTVEAAQGAAAKLAFTVQPTNTEAGVTLSPTVQVTVEDANGVPVTSATNQITLTLNSPGTATLGGTTVINASGGVATFSGLAVNGESFTNTYTLQASASGLTSATSNQFTVFFSQIPDCSLAPHGNEYLMSGHWAALIQGWAGGGFGFPVHQVFAISTDGAGGLVNLDGAGMGGQIDRQNGASGASSFLSLTIEKAGSSYSIGQDPTSSGYVGCMSLATSNGGTVHYWFALGGITGSGTAARASKATVTRWDDINGTGARGTGVMLQQDSTKFSLASLSPNYAFGLSGVDPSGGPFAEAGSVTLNTTNGTTSFEFDSDDAGSGGFFTGGTGTVSATSTTNLTGRVTVASSIQISGVGTVNSTAIEYIVNNNEIFHLSADPFGGANQFPIASGRLIVTNHGNFGPISGNFMIHMTGITTVSSGGGCAQNGSLVDCADVNLVAVTATPTTGQASNISGYSWEYSKGNTVTPNTLSGLTGTVDATWGRLSFTGTNVNQAPVFYLASPQTGTDATEPYVGFGAGSGTGANLDPNALSGFVETGASTNVSQSAVAGNYFFYTEMPADNYVSTGVGVANILSSGTVTGTQYAQAGSAGLQSASLSSGGGSTITITNQDSVVPADTFPGIMNVGPGSFGLTNGKRFVFFDEGSGGNSNAQFTVVDQQ